MRKFRDSVSFFVSETDKILLLLCLLTSAFGVLMVHSATLNSLKENQAISSDVRTMILAIFLGLLAALVISLIDYEALVKLWPAFAGLGILLMILVFIFGKAPSVREDARTWLDLGIFYFQPSELVKICFIITFSVHLNAVKENINSFKNIFLLGIHALIPVALVMKSGDDGSALVFILIALCMLFIGGISWKYILSGCVLSLAAIPLLWVKLTSFQKERFIVILHPELYPDRAYQQNMSLSAIGSGGFFGRGLFKGSYTQNNKVPENKNDMIFSVVGEEFGMLGAIIVFALIIAIIFRIIQTGKRANSTPATLICYGIGSMIAVQTFINIAMCLRIGPVIGITLPFFSAGGSSTLCLYIGIGAILSIYRSTHNVRATNYRLTSIRSPFV
ncbi:MAG: FtsW/RodA/SpoVE family cell cycle protein [Oscillospiraceae bacterium]